MKVTLESTDRIVSIVNDRAVIKARVWEGQMDDGTWVSAIIPRISLKPGETRQEVIDEFDAQLEKTEEPTEDAIQCWPARFVL